MAFFPKIVFIKNQEVDVTYLGWSEKGEMYITF